MSPNLLKLRTLKDAYIRRAKILDDIFKAIALDKPWYQIDIPLYISTKDLYAMQDDLTWAEAEVGQVVMADPPSSLIAMSYKIKIK